MSGLLVSLLIVAGAALVGLGGIMLKHWIYPARPDSAPGEHISEYIAMMVGVLYALVLGVALVAVWEGRDTAESNVRTEASSLDQIYVLAADIPAPNGPQIRQDVQAYANLVVDKEWSEMAAHQPLGQAGWTSLGDLASAIENYKPANVAQQNVSAEALSQLSTVYDARRSRDGDSHEGLSSILWVGLILGGALTALLVFSFGVQRRRNHLAMVMGLTALMGFVILLIYDINHPFSGVMGIDKDVLTRYFSVT